MDEPEEVVIRVVVVKRSPNTLPAGEEERYEATSDMLYGYFYGRTQEEAIANLLCELAASYKE